jgi:hypothetical protein
MRGLHATRANGVVQHNKIGANEYSDVPMSFTG